MTKAERLRRALDDDTPLTEEVSEAARTLEKMIEAFRRGKTISVDKIEAILSVDGWL